MTERCLIQSFPPRLPIRQVPVHQPGEALTVALFEQVRHLVHHEVLEAVGVLLG
jgi:hypothetical protein